MARRVANAEACWSSPASTASRRLVPSGLGVTSAFDVAAASRRLNLHPSSVRYRLRRIEEITSIDLADAEHLAVIAMLAMAGRSAGMGLVRRQRDG